VEKKEWCDDRKEHLRYLLNMTKFPEAYRQNAKSKANSDTVPVKVESA
jgi:hypothetical protein